MNDATCYKVWADYIDTCLPCYLADGALQDGELLLCCVPESADVESAVEGLMDSMIGLEDSLPDAVSDEMIRAALTVCCSELSWPIVPESWNSAEGHDPDDFIWAYVRLTWRQI